MAGGVGFFFVFFFSQGCDLGIYRGSRYGGHLLHTNQLTSLYFLPLNISTLIKFP